MCLNKCCCCIDLQTGCIVLAIIGFIINFGLFGLADTHCGGGGCSYAFYVVALGNVTGIIGCVCLLFGAIKKISIAVEVYLGVEIIRIILYFANVIMILKRYVEYPDMSDTYKNTVLASGICVLLVMLTSLYFWICVFSFFQKLGLCDCR